MLFLKLGVYHLCTPVQKRVGSRRENYAALVIISFIFANAHMNPTPVNRLLRFFQFMIYRALYYLNGRNLLPAIVVHATWNLILLNPVVF